MSPLDFGKISVRRNLLIADLFHRMGKVERIGSGIKRMRDLMLAAGLKEPGFEITSFFRAAFYRNPEYSLKHAGGPGKETVVEKTREKTKEKMLAFIAESPHITADELAKKHFKNIFETGELREDSVISILETTAAKGKQGQRPFFR